MSQCFVCTAVIGPCQQPANESCPLLEVGVPRAVVAGAVESRETGLCDEEAPASPSEAPGPGGNGRAWPVPCMRCHWLCRADVVVFRGGYIDKERTSGQATLFLGWPICRHLLKQ